LKEQTKKKKKKKILKSGRPRYRHWQPNEFYTKPRYRPRRREKISNDLGKGQQK